MLATVLLLALCIVFGGGNRAHALRLAVVELASLPLLSLALLRLHDVGDALRHRFILSIAASIALVPLIQIVPLPPQFWTALPGREQAVLALEVAGLEASWSPMSLTPDQTSRDFLALLPPMAIFLAAMTLDKSALRTVLWALLGLTAASIMLGMAQVMVGGNLLYPWSTSSPGTVSGFFSNRNHLATLCLVGLPLASVLVAATLRGRDDGQVAAWAGALFVVLAIVALGAIRSRGGILLAGPVLGLTALTAWLAWGRARPGAPLLGIIAAFGVAITLVAALGLDPILARFDRDMPPEARFERWPIVVEAAQAYLPVGSGLGSFDAVYRSVEPLEQLDETYFNRAHNDYLESWLETGWLGGGIFLAFLVWFGRRSWAVWRAGVGSEADLARAASVGILAMLIHSVAEYPLRTVTMMATLALLCAIVERAGAPSIAVKDVGAPRLDPPPPVLRDGELVS